MGKRVIGMRKTQKNALRAVLFSAAVLLILPLSVANAQETFDELFDSTPEKTSGDRFLISDFNDIWRLIKNIFVGSGVDETFGTADDRIGFGGNPRQDFDVDVTGKLGADEFCDPATGNCETAASILDVAGAGPAVMGVFAGKSALTTDGSVSYSALDGYVAANAICDAEFTGTHFCTEGEVMASMSELTPGELAGLGWSGPVWVATGGSKSLPAVANDCAGWTSATSSYYGVFWDLDNNVPRTGTCDSSNTLSLACCT